MKSANNKYEKTYGWAISLAVHLLIIAAFLLIGIAASSSEKPDRDPPHTFIQSQTQPLEETPHVNLELNRTDQFTPPTPDLSPDVIIPTDVPPPASASILTAKTNNAAFTTPNENSPNTGFCGSTGRARSICFVVDCSGSMVIAFDFVKNELINSIQTLTPEQYFNIIFFAGPKSPPDFSSHLERAHARNRIQAQIYVNKPFIKLQPVNDTREATAGVVEALQKALHSRSKEGDFPVELLFFLTDGEYNHVRVKQAIAATQKNRISPVKIHTIACGIKKNETFLKEIAEIYNGNYIYITDEIMANWTKNKDK